MRNVFLPLCLLACVTFLSTSCSGQHPDFTVAFPYGYKYSRITSDYHVITGKNPVSGADVIEISANVSLIGYHHPFIVGKVTNPSSLVEASNVELGYFVLNVQNGNKETGLDESRFSGRLQELEIDEIDLLSPRKFVSEENPLLTSGLLWIE